jgi:2-oxoisovalerate dehydrogenase E2 component (dihydrolipoyl transacylase)
VKRIIKASPAVRALAGRLGVELEECTPTGENGRVVREDVERAAGAGIPTPTPAAPAARAAAPAAAPAPRAPAAPAPIAFSADRGDAVERMEMGRTRKVMYKAMGSMGDVPHFGYVHTLNLTNLLPLMKAANAAPSEPKGYLAADVPPSLVHPAPTPARQKTSVLAFLVKALSLALEEHPIMRARMREADGQRWLDVSRDANIGIAVSGKLSKLTSAQHAK